MQLLNFLLALDRVDKWAVDYNESESPKALEIQLCKTCNASSRRACRSCTAFLANLRTSCVT
ncbi:hypothetical protein [Aeromonas veronii]|uniref:hypothetical protein n=1 Tax=Aeromonas veronii TaxID=654 RepID=UPI001F0A7841|nr:hypothetical protein [Aeromonas veronii]